MENWGLIAYREYALLYEEGDPPSELKGFTHRTLRCDV